VLRVKRIKRVIEGLGKIERMAFAHITKLLHRLSLPCNSSYNGLCQQKLARQWAPLLLRRKEFGSGSMKVAKEYKEYSAEIIEIVIHRWQRFFPEYLGFLPDHELEAEVKSAGESREEEAKEKKKNTVDLGKEALQAAEQGTTQLVLDLDICQLDPAQREEFERKFIFDMALSLGIPPEFITIDACEGTATEQEVCDQKKEQLGRKVQQREQNAYQLAAKDVHIIEDDESPQSTQTVASCVDHDDANAADNVITLDKFESVEMLLEAINSAECCAAFKREKVMLEDIPRLRDRDLQALGMRLGPLRRLQELIGRGRG